MEVETGLSTDMFLTRLIIHVDPDKNLTSVDSSE